VSARRAGTAGQLACALLIAAVPGACVHPYQVPALTEPHAMVKVELTYHDQPGPELTQEVHINGTPLDVPHPAQTRLRTVSRIVPVRLAPTRWQIETTFFHWTRTASFRTVTDEVNTSCGTAGDLNRYCAKTVQRTEGRSDFKRVPDAACAQSVSQAPQENGVYVLRYDFYANQRCTLGCIRQWPQPDGTLRDAPCEPAPATGQPHQP
jgi:hypothetical protein